MILDNLLTGRLPDTAGLLVFGVALIGSSVVLRRLIVTETDLETEEIVVEDRS